jgi:hypothetical protein
MALTRAQLLAGNSSQGIVLSGQVQGVKQGVGVIIDGDGTISFDSTSATGVMRLNNTSAFNGYVWPSGGPFPNNSIPQYTSGTGLINWTLNYVSTTGPTGAAQAPTGGTTGRPLPPSAGQFRFNTDLGLMEVYTGTAWIPIGAAIQAGLGINLSGTAPNEMYKLETPIQTGPPAAGTLPAEAIDGSLYWDDTQGLLFIRYNDGTSTQWVQVVPSAPPASTITGTVPIVASGTNISLNIGLGNKENGGFLKAETPVQTGPPAAGTGQLQAIDGSLYWDNTQGLLFVRYNDGTSTQWVQVTPVTPAPSGYSGSFLSQTGQTVTVVNGIITTVV